MKYFYILLFTLILSSCQGGGGDQTNVPISNNEATEESTPLTDSDKAAGVTIAELRTMVTAAKASVADGVTLEEAGEVLALDDLVNAKAAEVAGTPDEAEVAVLVEEVAVLVEEVVVATTTPPEPVVTGYDLTTHTFQDGFYRDIPFYSNTAEVAAMDQTPVSVGDRAWVYTYHVSGDVCNEYVAIAEFVNDGTRITDGSLVNVETAGANCVGQGGPNQPYDQLNGTNVELTPTQMLKALVDYESGLQSIGQGSIISLDEFSDVGITYSYHYISGRVLTFKLQ